MTIDEVKAKAKQDGLELTEAEIDEIVKGKPFPEKKVILSGSSIEDLINKYTQRQLAEMLVDTRSEAKDRRLENKELKLNIENLTIELNKTKDMMIKYPELEKQLQGANNLVQKFKDGEKKRREAILMKLEKEQQEALDYLLNVDNVPSEKFDATVDLFVKIKSDGMPRTHPPKEGEPVVLTGTDKQEAERLGLAPEAYLDIKKQREARKLKTTEH